MPRNGKIVETESVLVVLVVSGTGGWRVGTGIVSDYYSVPGFFVGKQRFKIKLWWWLYNFVNMWKPIELYNLKGWIVSYINYISIKMLKTIQKKYS